MDGDIGQTTKAAAQGFDVFRMEFAGHEVVLRTQNMLREGGGAGVEAESFNRALIFGQGGNVLPKEARYTVMPFPSFFGFEALEVVMAEARMGIEYAEPSLLFAQGTQQGEEQGVFYAVGEVSGMVGVAVVHGKGLILKGRLRYVLITASVGVRQGRFR